MDLDALRYALRVVDLGSFTAVAREADVAHSSVSRAISGLEDHLGVRLFQRTSRRLSLTAEGESYLSRVAPLLDEMDAARHSARNDRLTARGRLRLTASVAYGTTMIAPHLDRLRSRAPDLEVELILSDGNLDLVAERIDLAVRLAPAPEGELISARLHDTRYHVVASPGWLAAHKTPPDPTALSQVDCLRGTLPGHRDLWKFRKSDEREVIEVPIGGQILLSNPLAQRAAAVEGLGPCLLADWLIERDLQDGRLVPLCADHEVTPTRFETAAWLLYPSRTYLPAKVRVAIDFLRGLRQKSGLQEGE